MTYSQGEGTFQVSMELFAVNRSRLCEKLKKNANIPTSSIVILQGGQSTSRYCTDTENLFRQV